MRSRQIGHSDSSAPGTGICAAIAAAAAAADREATFWTLKTELKKLSKKKR